MSISIINEFDDISSKLLSEDGYIKLFSAEYYKNLKWNDFRAFCHFHARYGIITVELALMLNQIIDGRDVIEIGAGCGDIGHHCQIHMTDSKIQEDPLVIKQYEAMQQPIIKYPNEVEKIDALDAVIKYKPKVVIASWVTTYAPKEMDYGSSPHGIKEDKILDLVDTYILIGNIDIHGDKPIMRLPHEELYFDWIVSRAKNQENNRIWIWSK